MKGQLTLGGRTDGCTYVGRRRRNRWLNDSRADVVWVGRWWRVVTHADVIRTAWLGVVHAIVGVGRCVRAHACLADVFLENLQNNNFEQLTIRRTL